MKKKHDPLDLDVIAYGKWAESMGAKRVEWLSDEERAEMLAENNKEVDLNRAFRDYEYARKWLLIYSITYEWLEPEHTKMTRKKAIAGLRIMALLGCAVTNQDSCKVCAARERAKNMPKRNNRR